MILSEKYTLSNGVEIPKLGLGTWLIPNDQVIDVVKDAISLGYRHIDTAFAYGNEQGVGEAIRNSGIPRDEIFITTKLEAEANTYEGAKNGIEKALDKLGLDYIDMILIHSPEPWKDFHGENRYFENNREVWKALEEAYKDGKVKAIGVSNFLKEDLENILESCEIKPMVNQILTHISNTPLELIDFCKSNNILVEAYSPIAHGEAMNNKNIVDMANKYGVTVPQLCIRYTLELELVSLPKTSNKEHLKDNTNVDFSISKEDMDVLKKIDKIKDYGEHSFFPVFSGK